ncbi:unnamed protein product [Amoebophrya sp. A120]|nr:unnamed protein product [Amoebophrya sp. A120]|eukprot:GSA120T00020057001.1
MSSRAESAAGSGNGDMSPTTELILEEDEAMLSSKETTLRWYSEGDKLWVRKKIEVQHKKTGTGMTILKNPAPWSKESRLLAPEENNVDWGELDEILPVHKWIIEFILKGRAEVTQNITLESVRRDIENSLDPEGTAPPKRKLKRLSRIVHKECLDKDKSAVMKKGGFQEGEEYGRKGRGRGDKKQVGKWNEFFSINADETGSSSSSLTRKTNRAPHDQVPPITSASSSSSILSSRLPTTEQQRDEPTSAPSQETLRKGEAPLIERLKKAQNERDRTQTYGGHAKAKSGEKVLELADLQKWKPKEQDGGRSYPKEREQGVNTSAAADLQIWEQYLQHLKEEQLLCEQDAAAAATASATESATHTARARAAACRIEEIKPLVENLRNRGGTHFAFEYEQSAIDEFLAEERRKEKNKPGASSFLKKVCSVDERGKGNVLIVDHITSCKKAELVNLVFKTEIQEHTDKWRLLAEALNPSQEKNKKREDDATALHLALTERARQETQREKKKLEEEFFRECPWYVVLDGGKPALKDCDLFDSENGQGHMVAAEEIVLQDRRVALTSDYKLVTLSPKQLQGKRLLLALSAYHEFDLGYLEKRLNDFAKPGDVCLPYETCDCATLTGIYDQLTRFGAATPDSSELVNKANAHHLNLGTHKVMLRWTWFSHLFGSSNLNCRSLADYIYVSFNKFSCLWTAMKTTYDLLRIGLPIRETMRADGAFRFYFDFVINYKHSDPSLFLTEEELLEPNCPLIIAMQHAVHALYPTQGAYPCVVWRGSGFDRYQDMQCTLRLRFVFPEVVCEYRSALQVRNYIANYLDNRCRREQNALDEATAKGSAPLRNVPTPTCDFLKKLKDKSSKGSVNDKKSLDVVKFILPDNGMEPERGGYPTKDSTIDMIWGDMALPATAAASQASKARCRNLVWRIDTKKGSDKVKKSKVGMMLQKPPDLNRAPTPEEQAATIRYYSFDEWWSEHRIKNNFELYQKHFSIALKYKPTKEVHDLLMRFRGPTRDTEAEHSLSEMCKVPRKETEVTRKRVLRGRTGGGS